MSAADNLTATDPFSSSDSDLYDTDVDDMNDMERSVSTSSEHLVAEFTIDPRPAQVGETVTFDASQSTGHITEYRWDLTGDGEVDEVTTDPVTTHVYEEADNFVVTLEIVGVEEETDTAVREMAVEPEPLQAALTVDPIPATVGETVTFDAGESTGQIVEYRWDLTGDGEVDEVTADPVLTATYDEPASFVATLEVADGEENTDTTGHDVIVESEPLEAAFTIDPRPAEVGETVTFDASESTGQIDEYRWDLTGDGEFDEVTTDPVTTHVYEEAGNFVVALEVVDEEGETDTEIREMAVEPEPLQAALTVDPIPATVGETVTFDAGESTGQIVEYRWDLTGDGEVDEVTADPVITTTYDEPASFVATVEVADGEENTDTTGHDVIVESEPLVAAFTIDPRPAQVGETVTFDASDSEGDIEEYRWDLTGDGEFDEVTTGPETTYTYDEPDTFVVTLEVAGEEGNTDTAIREMAVEPAPLVAAFTIDPRPAQVGETVTFDASDSEGDITEYRWDLTGDGEFDQVTTGPETTYTYDEPDTFVVTLEVADEMERTDTALREMAVEPAPREPIVADFTIDPRPATVGETVTFDATPSEGNIVEYRWDFTDDGETDLGTGDLTATYTYTEPGTYTVTLVVEAGDGRTDTATERLEVLPETVARCSVEPETVEPGEEVTIDATGSENAMAVEFDTNGDGEFDEVRSGDEPFTVEMSYDEEGELTPRIRVIGERERIQELDCATIVIEEDDDPIPVDERFLVLLGGLALLGGLGYGASRYFPRPPRGTPSASHEQTMYDTGVIRVDPEEGVVSVTGIEFEPDLLLVSASSAVPDGDDRTVGWSWGRAVRGEEGIEQFATAVADDTESTERGTCETTTGSVFEVIAHADRAVDRLRGEVVEFTPEGVDISVDTVGDIDEPVHLLYQAFAGGGELAYDAGRVHGGDGPGPTALEFDVDPSMVRLETSTAVGEDGTTRTTDRSIGLSAGMVAATGDGEEAGVAAGPSLAQAGFGAVASPLRARHATSSCGDDHVLSLAYLDGERIAGTTRATATRLDDFLELHFERAYSGPHRIDPTGGHPIDYLAIDAGDLTPAVGRIEVPAAGERETVPLEFEPGLLELVAVRSGEDGSEASPRGVPLGWSHGTAIHREDGIHQYVLDGTRTAPATADEDVAQPVPAEGESDASVDAGTIPEPDAGIDQSGQVASDGGQPEEPDTRSRYSKGSVDPTELGEPDPSQWSDVIDEARLPGEDSGGVTGRIKESLLGGDEEAEGGLDEASPEGAVDQMPDPGVPQPSSGSPLQGTAGGQAGPTSDSGDVLPGSDHAAVAVETSESGEIVDRREVAVTAMVEGGFAVEAEGFGTDEPAEGESTYLWYVAWPALNHVETGGNREQ